MGIISTKYDNRVESEETLWCLATFIHLWLLTWNGVDKYGNRPRVQLLYTSHRTRLLNFGYQLIYNACYRWVHELHSIFRFNYMIHDNPLRWQWPVPSLSLSLLSVCLNVFVLCTQTQINPITTSSMLSLSSLYVSVLCAWAVNVAMLTIDQAHQTTALVRRHPNQ